MSEITIEEARDLLVHHGTKGMHWGVRKARATQLNRDVGLLTRVSKGGGSAREKLAVAVSNPLLPSLKRKSIARKISSKTAQRDRLVNGRASALDVFKAYGTVNIITLARQ